MNPTGLKSILLYIALLPLAVIGQNANVLHVNANKFQSLVTSQPGTLLDVRTSTEYKNGHIKGAGQLNYYAFDFKQKLLLLPKNHTVYLYCNTGWRSKRATKILIRNGYNQVVNLEHGILDWQLNDLPVKIEPDARPDKKNSMEPDEFKALINSDTPVFIDFYAPWCGPCRKMMPMIDNLKDQYRRKVRVVKVNTDASKKLNKLLQINTVPYLVMYHKGVSVFTHKGIINNTQAAEIFERFSRID